MFSCPKQLIFNYLSQKLYTKAKLKRCKDSDREEAMLEGEGQRERALQIVIK